MKIVDNPKTIFINDYFHNHKGDTPVVQDYEEIFERLKNGETVVHWESGNSLHPIIKNMEYCLIKPIENPSRDIKVGDCVFCDLGMGAFMVHRVVDIVEHPKEGKWFAIGNTWGETYGWTQKVYGIAFETGFFQKNTHEWKKKLTKLKKILLINIFF